MVSLRYAICALIVLTILAGTSSDGARAQEQGGATPPGTVAELVKTMASAELEPGIFFESHIIKPPDLALQEVWIYHPNPLPSQRMSLVVVPPAGGNFISAPGRSGNSKR